MSVETRLIQCYVITQIQYVTSGSRRLHIKIIFSQKSFGIKTHLLKTRSGHALFPHTLSLFAHLTPFNLLSTPIFKTPWRFTFYRAISIQMRRFVCAVQWYLCRSSIRPRWNKKMQAKCTPEGKHVEAKRTRKLANQKTGKSTKLACEWMSYEAKWSLQS